MNRAAAWTLILCLLSPAPCRAAEAKTSSKASVQPKAKEDPEKAAERKAKLRKETEAKRQDLNGTQWEIAVDSQDPKAKGKGKDILTFQNNQVQSRNLSKRGYQPTNYTITPLDDGERALWESMQTSSEGVVFLRGDWKEGVMTGTLTEQLENGTVTHDYFFTSELRKEVPETSEEKDAAKEAAEAKAPAKTLTSEAKKKDEATSSKSAPKKKSRLSSY